MPGNDDRHRTRAHSYSPAYSFQPLLNQIFKDAAKGKRITYHARHELGLTLRFENDSLKVLRENVARFLREINTSETDNFQLLGGTVDKGRRTADIKLTSARAFCQSADAEFNNNAKEKAYQAVIMDADFRVQCSWSNVTTVTTPDGTRFDMVPKRITPA